MKISIEQYENLVELLKQALEFYANENNYYGDNEFELSIMLKDSGSQARFALKKIEELKEINEKLEQDIINGVENTINSEDDDFENIINNFNKKYGN